MKKSTIALALYVLATSSLPALAREEENWNLTRPGVCEDLQKVVAEGKRAEDELAKIDPSRRMEFRIYMRVYELERKISNGKLAENTIKLRCR